VRDESLRLDFLSAAVVSYLAESATNSVQPSIAGFARSVGVKRPTLYAAYPEVVAAIRAGSDAAAASKTRGPRDVQVQELKKTLSIKNRELREMNERLGVYAEQIRRLALENAQLRAALESATSVLRLPARKSLDSPDGS